LLTLKTHTAIQSLKFNIILVLTIIGSYSRAQDSLLTISLEDVSIIDFKTDHSEVFKHVELDLNGVKNGIDASLEETLKRTIPIYFKNYSYGGIASIDFRGTGAERTQVYWNGMLINSPSLGSFDFSLIPSFFISDAKIRFGGASLVDGGGGIGASIQLNQNTLFEENSIELIGSHGSFSNTSSGVKVQLKFNKFKTDTRFYMQIGENNFSFKNTSKKDHPIEERKHNEVKQLAFQQSFSYQLNKNNSVELNFLYSDMDRNIPAPISSSDSGAWQGDRMIITNVAYNTIFKNEMYLKYRFSYQKQDNQFKDKAIDAKNTIDAWANKLDLGSEINYWLNVNASLNHTFYKVNTFGTGNQSEQQFSGLLAADIRISPLVSSSLGIRVDGRDEQVFLPMPFLGLAWDLFKKYGKLKANISRVYRYPTMNERFWDPGGNPNLNPEQGWNSELSYELLKEKERLSFQFQANVFYALIENWILWSPSNDNPLIWEAQNLWKVESRGLEIISGMKWKFSKSINASVKVLYTFNSTRIVKTKDDDNLEDKQMILVPKHMVFIPFLVEIKNLSLGINYQYTGIRYSDRLNSNTLDPYHLLDFTIHYLIEKPGISLGFEVNNLLNYTYETYPGQIMPGINSIFQLSWKLN
jgi:iron complex outermembrane receptor protein